MPALRHRDELLGDVRAVPDQGFLLRGVPHAVWDPGGRGELREVVPGSRAAEDRMSKRKHHLTTEQVDAIDAYIRQIRDLMGLAHWDVYLATDPAPKGAHASIKPCEGRLVAPLNVSKGWWDRAADDKRNDIVHELLHVLHRDQTDTIRVGLLRSGYLPDKARAMLWAQFSAHTEVMVDHLAGVIAPSMPAWTGVA